MSEPSMKVQLRQRVAGGLLGLFLLSGAALSAEMAGARYVAMGHICGGGDSLHCGWCLATAGLALAGFFALALALFPEPEPVRADA